MNLTDVMFGVALGFALACVMCIVVTGFYLRDRKRQLRDREQFLRVANRR